MTDGPTCCYLEIDGLDGGSTWNVFVIVEATGDELVGVGDRHIIHSIDAISVEQHFSGSETLEGAVHHCRLHVMTPSDTQQRFLLKGHRYNVRLRPEQRRRRHSRQV